MSQKEREVLSLLKPLFVVVVVAPVFARFAVAVATTDGGRAAAPPLRGVFGCCDDLGSGAACVCDGFWAAAAAAAAAAVVGFVALVAAAREASVFCFFVFRVSSFPSAADAGGRPLRGAFDAVAAGSARATAAEAGRGCLLVPVS